MALIIIGIIILLIILLVLGALLDLYAGVKIQHPKLPEGLCKPSRNKIVFFQEGRHFFSALENDIKQANKHVHLSFYIFREDTCGQKLFRLLEKRAQEGIHVRLLVDALGSRKLSKQLKARLAAAGVEFAYSAKPSFPFFFYNLSRRHHRKIAVIDGKAGYFGGFNVGDEYMGKAVDFGEWRDYHLKITGKGVHYLQEQFLNDWHTSTKQTITDVELFPVVEEQGPVKLVLLATNGKQLEQTFTYHISQAQKSLVIGSPYFIPSPALQSALLTRLESGVKVTLILPGRKDHPMVKPASFRYLKPLVEKGLVLHHFYQGFYHGKFFIIDDTAAYIGTANFDNRSLHWNDELSGFIYNDDFVRTLKRHIEDDIQSRSSTVTLDQITNRPITAKVKTALSCLFAPLL